LSPNKAAEIAKLIDDYVKAYQTAELDDRVALSANASARAAVHGALEAEGLIPWPSSPP
jgi:hypothetical protein